MTDRPDFDGPDSGGADLESDLESDARHEAEFDAGAHADLSRLLREAHEQPVLPAAVADRLDDVLAGLVADRSHEHPTQGAVVVPLRRRVWPKALVAAAAVVVLGGAGVTVLQQQAGHDAGTASSSADSKVASGDAAGGAAEKHAPTPPMSALSGEIPSRSLAGEPSPAQSLEERDQLSRRDARVTLPVLTTADFAVQAKELAGSPSYNLRSAPASDEPRASAAARTCAGPPISSASTRVEQVVLDGEVAALVIGPETEGTVAVSAWTCDGSRELIKAQVRP